MSLLYTAKAFIHMATVLIVEDEPEISSLLESFIEEQGH
jgi:CheY-like chemotaxis protein